MLTFLTSIYEGRFSLFLYGTEKHQTKVYEFVEEVEKKIEKRLEVVIRQIDSSPLTYSHEHNFKLLENKVWEMKFVSQQIRLACIWDPKPQNLVIFYGFKKKTQKWPARELENMRSELKKYFEDKVKETKGGETK